MPPTPDDAPPAPDWDARITLLDAAALCGLTADYLRQRALRGDLRTERVGARLHVTTRRWLDDYLRARGSQYHGRPPKPLPPDYQPPPRRGRPPKAKTTPDQPTGEQHP